MYTEYRPAVVPGATASTPELWAEMFAKSGRLTKWREMRYASWYQMKLIRRHIPRGARILDAGCGFGEWVTLLRRRGYDAEGLDYSSTLIERLRHEYPDTPWHLGDIRSTDIASGSFDAVISWGVIEHDPAGPGAALREFARILRPGGVAIVTVPRDSEVTRALSRVEFPTTDGHEFFQFFMTEAELAKHMLDAGFEVMENGTTRTPSLAMVVAPHFQRSRWFSIASMLFAFVARWTRRYDSMIYCVARKGTA